MLLSLGAVFGFASGIHHLRYGGGWGERCGGERERFERHIAEICADAAVRAHPTPSAP